MDVEMLAKALSWDLENDPTPVDRAFCESLTGWELIEMRNFRYWRRGYLTIEEDSDLGFAFYQNGVQTLKPTRGQVRTLLRLMDK